MPDKDPEISALLHEDRVFEASPEFRAKASVKDASPYDEAERDPEMVKAAPHTAPVKRLDEATAARQPNLRWRPMAGAEMPCPD